MKEQIWRFDAWAMRYRPYLILLVLAAIVADLAWILSR